MALAESAPRVVIQFRSPEYRHGAWCDQDVGHALFEGLPFLARRGVQGDLYRHLITLYREGAGPDVARSIVHEIQKRGRRDYDYRIIRRTTAVDEEVIS